jgi:hypothetical protein
MYIYIYIYIYIFIFTHHVTNETTTVVMYEVSGTQSCGQLCVYSPRPQGVITREITRTGRLQTANSFAFTHHATNETTPVVMYEVRGTRSGGQLRVYSPCLGGVIAREMKTGRLQKFNKHTHTFIYTYPRTHSWALAVCYMHIYAYTHVYVQTQIASSDRLLYAAHTHTHTRTNTHTHTRTNTHTHTRVHTYPQTQVVSSGRVLYVGDKNGTVTIIEARDQVWENVATLTGQTKRVTAVYYCKRNGTVISSSMDSTIRVRVLLEWSLRVIVIQNSTFGNVHCWSDRYMMLHKYDAYIFV